MADNDNWIHQDLIDLGYIGTTGSTPYRPPTADELQTLQNIHADRSVINVPRTVATDAVVVNVNFHGTHNNGQFPAQGESATNFALPTRR